MIEVQAIYIIMHQYVKMVNEQYHHLNENQQCLTSLIGSSTMFGIMISVIIHELN